MRRFLALVVGSLVLLSLTAAGWPTNHGDARRSGYLPTQKKFTGTLTTAFTKTLDGAVYGSPILVGTNVVVATENNTVYAFDAATGAPRWSRHLHTPVARSALPCGNIDPLGITGTPTYNAATNRIFVITESPDATSVARHEVFGLNATTGATEVNRRMEVPGTDPKAQQQRAALADDGKGNIYAAFGGLAGDCGNYKGAVISFKASGALGAKAYVVPTTREAGIWAAGGPVIDSAGSVYVSVGNGESTSGFDYSDSVTKLNSTAQRIDYFAPTTWASDNASDLDLGSLTPALTSNGRILQAGKSGTGYVLNPAHLGGIGGQLYKASLCAAFGVSAVTGSTVYLPCTNGVTRVEVSTAGTFTVKWKQGSVNGSPVAGNGALYTLGNGNLYAVSGSTGQILKSIAVGTTTRFATPALGPSRIYIGTTTGLTVVNVA
ncbi:MAG TPA: PQQ-binding-like beta-propeller repeat protein [Jatrophihabitantaceae bacterium]|nr:PQQ-binding-like beta-propeller repeat protein [Jatrophihabitantaceae bacterium]